MKRNIGCILFTLYLGMIAASGVEPAQPGTSSERGSTPARPDGGPQRRQWSQSKAEWLDPDRGAPNGTQYKTFASKVLGRDVSYLVWLPPGSEEGTKRYPVIYWLHGIGANQRGDA